MSIRGEAEHLRSEFIPGELQHSREVVVLFRPGVPGLRVEKPTACKELERLPISPNISCVITLM